MSTPNEQEEPSRDEQPTPEPVESAAGDPPTPDDPPPTEAEPEVVEAEVVEAKPFDPERARLVQEVRRLEAQLGEREAQLRDLQGRLRGVSKAYQDLEKDMDEFRKRVQAQAGIQAEKKGHELVGRVFEPVQNLVRALQAPGEDVVLFAEGVRLVLSQFQQVLHDLGLREIPGVGAVFDPAVHEALAIMPTPDPAQDGRVVAVHASGWLVGDKVVQPAQVVVAKYTEPAEA